QDGPCGHCDFAVRSTGVVDIAGGIAEDLAVDIVVVIQFKDVWVPCRGSLGSLCFGNLLSDIRYNPGPFFDILSRKESVSVNASWTNTRQNHHSFPPRAKLKHVSVFYPV